MLCTIIVRARAWEGYRDWVKNSQKGPQNGPQMAPPRAPPGPTYGPWLANSQYTPNIPPKNRLKNTPFWTPLQLLLSINYTGCHHLDQPQSWIETGFWTGIKQLIQPISSHYTAVHTCTYVPISLPTRYTATSAQPLNQLSQLPSTSYPDPIQTQNGPKIAEIQYNPPFRPYLSYILAPI
jgi:hypothetical protein